MGATVTRRGTDTGSGRSTPSGNGQPQNDGAVVFGVVTSGEFPTAQRGGAGRAANPIDPGVRQAFNDMLNPESANYGGYVPNLVMTNAKLRSVLQGSVTKLIATAPKGHLIKSAITVYPDSPNPRSTDAADNDKNVKFAWKVYRITEDQFKEEQQRKANNKAKRDAQANA